MPEVPLSLLDLAVVGRDDTVAEGLAATVDLARAAEERGYRRIWVEKKPKSVALWEAKMVLKNAKDEVGKLCWSTRDWAAWVLTGEPD